MIPESVELTLTFDCNWRCRYCIADTYNQPTLPFDEVLRKIHSISSGSEVTLTGGEPGLLTRLQITQVIDLLKAKDCALDLLTNGTFIRKYPDLLKEFGKVQYHCVEHVPGAVEFEIVDHPSVTHCLVVTTEDLLEDNITPMIERYPNIMFMLLPNVRARDKINLNLLMTALKKFEGKIHPGTLNEFVTVVSRWH